MISFKKEQLLQIQGRLPEQTIFIPIPFTDEDAYQQLVNQGLMPDSCASGSEVVFDCFDETTFTDQNCSPGFKQWLAQGMLTGEVFQSSWSREQLEMLASEQGFSMETYLNSPKIEQLYFSQEEKTYHACKHAQYVKFTRLKRAFLIKCKSFAKIIANHLHFLIGLW